jgi:ubiquinone/menaquinone biosynthesis C-methylase UbiE
MTISDWNAIAASYGQIECDTRRQFLFPALLAALPAVSGGTVLDFGCGCGDLVIPLAKRFRRVIAHDPAPRMLERARRGWDESHCPGAVEFLVDTRDIPDAEVDVGLASLVFQTIEEPDRILAALEEIARILRPDAPLLIAMSHPCFQFETIAASRYGDNGSPIAVTLGELRFLDYHRPLSSWVALFAAAGWVIRGLSEVYDEPSYYRNLGLQPSRFAGKLPLFLVVEMRIG